MNYSKHIKYIIIAITVLLIGIPMSGTSRKDTNITGSVSLSGNLNVLNGQVVDIDGQAVKNAEIVLPEQKLSVKTDNNGKFSVEIKRGTPVHVEVFKTGFLPASTDTISVKPDVPLLNQQIILHTSPLEEVVVTGTSTPKLYRETPVKTSVVSSKVIEEKGAVNLADSLETFTGVRVEDNCQNCNFTQVRINGMEGKYSQILIDGQPVISALAGVYALEQIPANMIEKLEVVKGGGSALYGGNAVAGVVNVVTKDPSTSGTRFALTQDSINSKPNTVLNLNTDFVSKDYNTHASFYTSYQRRQPMDYNDDDFSDLGELTNVSFGSNFSKYFEDISGKLRLSFAAIFEDRRGGNKFDLPEHMADIAESIKTYRTDFGLNWEQTFSAESILKFNSAFSYTRRKSYYGAEQDPNAYGTTKNPVFNASLTYYNFSLQNHSFVAGLSFNQDSIDDLAPAYNRTIDQTCRDLGVFVQDEISLFNKQVSLLAGVRLDKHSEISTVVFSPRASLMYKGIKNLTFRATYSTGFRAPQVFDEDLHITMIGGEGQVILNRDGLREEKSQSFTVGVDFGKQVFNKLYQFSVGGFYNRLNDVFTLEQVGSQGNALVFERFNSDTATVYGLEVEAGFKWAGKFEIFSGWTFQKSELKEPEPDFGSTELFRSPNVYGSVRMDVDFKKFVDLNVEMNYTGSMKVPHFAGYIAEDVLETSDPFVVFNVSLSRDIKVGKGKAITLTASVLNVFDEFQDDLDKGVYRDAGYIYGPRFPRTFRIGTKYKF